MQYRVCVFLTLAFNLSISVYVECAPLTFNVTMTVYSAWPMHRVTSAVLSVFLLELLKVSSLCSTVHFFLPTSLVLLRTAKSRDSICRVACRFSTYAFTSKKWLLSRRGTWFDRPDRPTAGQSCGPPSSVSVVVLQDNFPSSPRSQVHQRSKEATSRNMHNVYVSAVRAW